MVSSSLELKHCELWSNNGKSALRMTPRHYRARFYASIARTFLKRLYIIHWCCVLSLLMDRTELSPICRKLKSLETSFLGYLALLRVLIGRWHRLHLLSKSHVHQSTSRHSHDKVYSDWLQYSATFNRLSIDRSNLFAFGIYSNVFVRETGWLPTETFFQLATHSNQGTSVGQLQMR